MEDNIKGMMSPCVCTKDLPGNTVNEHGERNIVTNEMIGDQRIQIKRTNRAISENHFRIIPAYSIEIQKAIINDKRCAQSNYQNKMFIKYVLKALNHLSKNSIFKE